MRTTHELARNLTEHLKDPSKTISQAELLHLYKQGSLDSTQAFLVFSLFHDRMVQQENVVSVLDGALIFGILPLGTLLHGVIALLFCLLIITQTFIQQQSTTIIFQLCFAAFFFNVSYEASEMGFPISATLYHWVHDVIVLFFLNKCLG
jgi:hypothetical protein